MSFKWAASVRSACRVPSGEVPVCKWEGRRPFLASPCAWPEERAIKLNLQFIHHDLNSRNSMFCAFCFIILSLYQHSSSSVCDMALDDANLVLFVNIMGLIIIMLIVYAFYVSAPEEKKEQ